MSNIKWYVDNEETNDFYAGNSLTNFVVYITVWNNRNGNTNIGNIKNPTIVCKYKTIEDSKLIKYTNIEVLNRNNSSITKTDDSIIIKINDILSGNINDGDESVVNNLNFIKFKLTVDLNNTSIKENDLKEIYLEIK